MFIVEGNIGAGKSTFLTLLERFIPELAVIYEPIHRWDNVATASLLHSFYQDPHRWAYTLETYTMLCRVQDHLVEMEKKHQCAVMERSLFSGYYCFAKNSYMSGFLHPLEWNIYEQWFSFLTEKKVPRPEGFIYLRTQPVVAYARIVKRNRDAEQTIGFDYIQAIHDRHEEFLIQRDCSPLLARVPVLVLDADLDFEHDSVVQQGFIEQVKKFIAR